MATIAEKSRTKEIINRMQSIVDGAPSVPLSQGKISVYKDEMQALLTELAGQIDIEMKTYHEVNDRKGKLISEAKKEAEKIILEAEQTASRVRVNKTATGVSPLDYSKMSQDELDSLSNANEIYAASLIYTDEMLTEVSEMIQTAYENIRGDYEIVMQVMEEKLSTINSNREELMMGLQEMDAAERSQQILEIGQLLSNELYRSRMKAKMDSDEYEDGSIQLSLELVEEQEEKARLAAEKAERAQAALAQMTAERDALRATVQMMKKEGMAATVGAVKENTSPSFVQMEKEPAVKEPDEEYEVVYVSEDELEEGEEYEVEYVDDEEYEKIMHQLGKEGTSNEDTPKVDAEPLPVTEESVKADEEDAELGDIPLIPRFKKTQKIATISSDQMKDIQNAAVKEKKEKTEGSFIGRAVEQKEKSQLEETIQVDAGDMPVSGPKKDEKKSSKKVKDADIKTDDQGNEYVQATMKFSEDFEITEF